MKKAKFAKYFGKIDELLPRSLTLEQFVIATESGSKSFTLNVKANLVGYSKKDSISGLPLDFAKEVAHPDEIHSSASNYLKTKRTQLYRDELGHFQNNKTGIYQSTDYNFGKQIFYYRTLCSDCHGNGDINCQNCEATGYISCSNCHGSGVIHIRDSKTGLAKTQVCVHCKNGQRQCSVCSGTSRVVCNECSGEGVFSTLVEAFFQAKLTFSYNFGTSDENSEFALMVRSLTISKLIEICNVELTESSLENEQIVLSYTIGVPVTNFNLDINTKKQSVIAFSESGALCQKIYFLDDVLSSLIDYCKQFNAAGTIKKTPLLYQKLNKIPFIQQTIIDIDKSTSLENIMNSLKTNSLGFMSEKSMAVIAQSIKKSFKYSPKEASLIVTILFSLPIIFLGVYLAFQWLGSSGSFWHDICYSGLTVSGIMYFFMNSINFFKLKSHHSGLPKNLFISSRGVFKRMFYRGINYVILALIIGVASAHYQYKYTINKLGLKDSYAAKMLVAQSPKQPEASKPVKTKKKKKRYH